MNHFISIQTAADEYGISTRWIWKSIRVDRTLGTVGHDGALPDAGRRIVLLLDDDPDEEGQVVELPEREVATVNEKRFHTIQLKR